MEPSYECQDREDCVLDHGAFDSSLRRMAVIEEAVQVKSLPRYRAYVSCILQASRRGALSMAPSLPVFVAWHGLAFL